MSLYIYCLSKVPQIIHICCDLFCNL
ncbi:MAG: hypothetical protein GY756_08730 [bacterium]|nr:hypothetical protein [bacterium]